jgi:hypothetical protein
MEWLFVLFVLWILLLFAKGSNRSDKADQPPSHKPSKPTHQQPPPTAKPTQQPTPAPHDWQAQEANNEAMRQAEPLKARGDGYELHIGRMFERKGDLVIYNGLLRGYEDQGVDLIVFSKHEQTVNLVQCKHWKRYAFTSEHLIKIYQKLSTYQRDYFQLPPEAIRHYLAIHFSDEQIKQRLNQSQSYPLRKTLYLASDKVISDEARQQLTQLKDNIYRYNDMKIVIFGVE